MMRLFACVVAALLLILVILGCESSDKPDDGTDGAATTESGTQGAQSTENGASANDNVTPVEPSETEAEAADGTNAEENDVLPTIDVAAKEAIEVAYGADNIETMNYYGEYNGVHAVVIYELGVAYTHAMWSETVDGVTFHYRDGNRIFIFDGKDFWRLSEAFEKGIITHDDLVKIAGHLKSPDTYVDK